MYKFIILIIITHIAAEDYETKEIPNQGIYFEKFAKAALWDEAYKILTTIEIPNFSKEINEITQYYSAVKSLCEHISTDENHLCHILTEKINTEITEVVHNEFSIQPNKRSKRGLINLVGNTEKFLFGTMDNEDSKKIYDQLQIITSNKKKEVKLINEQTAVISSNYQTLIEANKKLTDDATRITDKMNELTEQTSNYITDQNNREKKNQLNEHFTEMTNILLTSCTTIIRKQMKFLSIMESLHQNRLHPLVLTIDDLTNALKNKSDQDFDKSILTTDNILKITKTEYTINEEYIIIKISIPIPQAERFNAYKIYLLPFEINNKTLILDIPDDTLLVNEDKTNFITENTQEMDHCVHVNEHANQILILCKNKKPILTINNERCSVKMFANPFNKTTNCKLTETKKHSTITRMIKTNAWLYSTNRQITLVMRTKTLSTTIRLNNTGILTIKKKSTLTTEDTIIPIAISSEVEVNATEYHFNPANTPLINFNDNTELPTINVKFLDHKSHNKNFAEELTKIEKLKEDSLDLEKTLSSQENSVLQQHLISNSIIIFTIITIIIITAIIWKIKYQKKKNAIDVNIELDTHPAIIPTPNNPPSPIWRSTNTRKSFRPKFNVI